MGAEALRQPLAKTRKSGLSHFFDTLGGEVHDVPLPFVLKREILYLRMAHDILDSSCLHIFTVSLGV